VPVQQLHCCAEGAVESDILQCIIIIIIIKLPDQAIASTPSAPRPPGAEEILQCITWWMHHSSISILHTPGVHTFMSRCQLLPQQPYHPHFEANMINNPCMPQPQQQFRARISVVVVMVVAVGV
jgi:hypothetical protein